MGKYLTEKEKEYIRKNAMTKRIWEIAEELGLKYPTVNSFINKNKIPHLSSSNKSENCLSPREFVVLSLVAKGYSNKEIAKELFVSEFTIKTHLINIYSKFSLSHKDRGGSEMRVKAVLMYLEQGEGLLYEIKKG